jgi:predicted membrane-bound spermidine synthase
MTKRPVPSSCARARVADLMITLAKKSTAFGEITILKSRARDSHVYCQGDWWQSEADRNGVSLAAYVHAIYALLAQSQAQQILMIGCGGGTLGTMLAAAAGQVTIVDINPESILLAQQYFSLPSHITCHVGDGQMFLECSPTLFDAIVVDAFVGDTIPQHLCSVNFFRLARRRLPASGCLFFNVYLRHDLDCSADFIGTCMAEAGFKVRVLDTPGPFERNAIVAGGAVTKLTEPSLLVIPKASRDELIAELENMQFRTGRPSWNSSPSANPIFSESQTP